MKIYTYILFITFCSCTANVKKEISQNEKILQINLVPQKDKELSISEIFEFTKLIFLETNKEVLLSDISKISIDDNSIFILNSYDKLVYSYDFNGGFKNRIGVKGNGPGELLYPGCFALNKSKKEVWMTNNFREIFKYDYNSNFISKEDCELFVDDLEISEKGQIYFFTSKKTNYEKGSNQTMSWELWIKSDLASVDAKVYFPYSYELYPNGGTFFSERTPFSALSNSFTFHYIYSDTIYSILEDGVEGKYVIDFAEKKIDEDFSLFSADQIFEYIQKNESKACFVNNVIETPGFLYFSYLMGMKRYHVFHNKATSNTMEGILPSNIYGANITFLTSVGDELIGYINPYEIDHMGFNDNIWGISNEDITKLKSVSEDDNPILIKCKIRNF